MRYLSVYERAILTKILGGRSAAEISAELDVPLGPILGHVETILRKLKSVQSRPELDRDHAC